MMHLFIGLDVHKKSWVVTIQQGHIVLKRFSMEAKADALIHYIDKHYKGCTVECCYEACCCGYHIYRNLAAAGWKVLVVNPGDIPRGNKQCTSKTDKIDSRHLCNLLAAGQLQGIYVPDQKQEQLRSLFRRRADLVKNLRRIKSHIKSMLLYYGIPVPQKYDRVTWSKEMLLWIEKLHWKHLPASQAMQSRLQEYIFLHKGYLQVCNDLRRYARTQCKKDYYLLRTIPGVGPFTAIGLLAEVGDIRRFKSLDHLNSYIGLVPSLYSSGEKSYSRGITCRSKSLLRSYLIEGAWIAAKKDPELMQYYLERKGCDHRKLIVKMAAKTLSRIYSVIKRGEPFKIYEPKVVL